MVAGRAPIQDAVSAGGVVWRRNARGAVEVVVCGRNGDAVWGLPKGTPDSGESLLQTAVREVQEETGLTVRPGEELGRIEYWFTLAGVRYHKQVHHWLMEPTGGDLADHDHEFDDVVWMEIGEAIRRVSYENERRVLRKAAEALEAVV